MVVSAVGEWARMLPGRFLNDAYLKYLAWALSDRSAPVRRAAVGAVRALLDDPACVPPMAEFLGRFGGRIMEMTGDVDDGVVAATLRLLARWESCDARCYVLVCHSKSCLQCQSALSLSRLPPSPLPPHHPPRDRHPHPSTHPHPPLPPHHPGWSRSSASPPPRSTAPSNSWQTPTRTSERPRGPSCQAVSRTWVGGRWRWGQRRPRARRRGARGGAGRRPHLPGEPGSRDCDLVLPH